MEAKPRTLRVYLTAKKQSPFRDWLVGLQDKLGRAAAERRLFQVSQGNLGDFKKIGEIFELRLDTGPGYRIYFGMDGLQLVVLLAGGDKSSQSHDIQTATRYWNDYQTSKTAADYSL
jgi:putative addiction module killer protein